MFIREVADRLGRSEAQVRWMLHQGTAPRPAKIAGRLVWKESQVEAFIEKAFADSEAEAAVS